MRPTKPTRSPHGTRARYSAGCSCFACCEAKRVYQRGILDHGLKARVDATEVRRHIMALHRQGLSYQEIAQRAGVAKCTISVIKNRQRLRVHRDNAEAILAVTTWEHSKRLSAEYRIDPSTLDALLDLTGTEPGALMDAAGITQATYSQIRRGRLVTEETAERIARAIGVRVDRLFEEAINAA